MRILAPCVVALALLAPAPASAQWGDILQLAPGDSLRLRVRGALRLDARWRACAATPCCCTSKGWRRIGRCRATTWSASSASETGPRARASATARCSGPSPASSRAPPRGSCWTSRAPSARVTPRTGSSRSPCAGQAWARSPGGSRAACWEAGDPVAGGSRWRSPRPLTVRPPAARPGRSMDLGAYLDRIGFTGEPAVDAETLRRVHHLHLLAIPYENLSVQLGTPVSLDVRETFDKIVRRGRGGWCYEMNGLPRLGPGRDRLRRDAHGGGRASLRAGGRRARQPPRPGCHPGRRSLARGRRLR